MTAQIISFPIRHTIEVSNNNLAVANSSVRYTRLRGVNVKEPETREEYLEICKSFLDPHDYQDILCGILDKEHYDCLEAQYKRVVDSYYEFPR
jgi:hypothetical protein